MPTSSTEDLENAIFMPNTTQIPNVVLDYWMGILGNAEFKVMLCICRKTFGWRKKQDAISNSQICEYTNLSKDIVRKALRCLEANQLIICKNNISAFGTSLPNTYEINLKILPQELGEEGLIRKESNRKSCEQSKSDKSNEKVNQEPCGGEGLASKGVGEGLASKGGRGLPASPTKPMSKPKALKGNDKAMPFESENKALEGGPSAYQKPKFAHMRFPLKKEQEAIFSWLKGQSLNTEDFTLVYWVRMYSFDKLKQAIDFLRYSQKIGIEKGSPIRNQAGFVRSVLDGKIQPVTETCFENKEFAKKFADENNYRDLEIHEKFVICKRSRKEVPLNQNCNEFRDSIVALHALSEYY